MPWTRAHANSGPEGQRVRFHAPTGAGARERDPTEHVRTRLERSDIGGGRRAPRLLHPSRSDSDGRCYWEVCLGRKSWQFDRRTAVHDDEQAGVKRALSGCLVDHAELQPHGSRADLDRLVNMGTRLI